MVGFPVRARGLIFAAALAAAMAGGVARAIDCPTGCDDGDPCTVDSCDPTAGCIFLPLTGLEALTCRLGVLRGNLGVALDLLRGTPARDLGGVAVKQLLVADVV